MTDRIVGHRIHGRIEVFAFADSIPEALALESALRQVAPAKAFQPEPHHGSRTPCERGPIPDGGEPCYCVKCYALPAEAPPIPDESSLPPHAVADADEAAPQMMDKAEAVSR